MPFNIPGLNLSNFKIEQIAGGIGAVLAIIALVTGLGASTVNEAGTNSSSQASSDSSSERIENEMEAPARDLRAAATDYLRAAGYTVTTKSNRIAQEMTENPTNSGSVPGSEYVTSGNGGGLSPYGVQQYTENFKTQAAELRRTNPNPEPQGIAGVGADWGAVSTNFMIYYFSDDLK